jgi:hypothetical protein
MSLPHFLHNKEKVVDPVSSAMFSLSRRNLLCKASVVSSRCFSTATGSQEVKKDFLGIFLISGMLIAGNLFTVWQEEDASTNGQEKRIENKLAPWELSDDQVAEIRRTYTRSV